MKRRHH